ncbi:MAG: hypothetical protein EP338_05040 [Bacteroidetes bacterium]|nr:MAG: hypothetical protein EP338_05040 [Bacteroidota bacterium]
MVKSGCLLFLLLIGVNVLMAQEMDQDAKRVLVNFAKAVRKHDQQKVMNVMDRAYVAEQHDDLLQGNTSQFLNEFFSGPMLNAPESFVVPAFNQIKKIVLIDSRRLSDTGSYEVNFKIILRDKRVLNRSWILHQVQSENKYALVGAVG